MWRIQEKSWKRESGLLPDLEGPILLPLSISLGVGATRGGGGGKIHLSAYGKSLVVLKGKGKSL